MDFREGTFVAASKASDPALSVLPENGTGVRDLLDLQRPGFLPWCQRLSSTIELFGLCIVHIALSGTVNPTDSLRR
jgi:hypothetical protein